MTEGLTCRRCGTPNRPGLAYCASCGQRLVAADEATLIRPGTSPESAPCPRCGASNRVGAAFCSACGFNIRLAVTPATPAAAPPPPATPETGGVGASSAAAQPTARAWLGPGVLLIAAVGLLIAWYLPFSAGGASLADDALGPGGYGLAFWTAYPEEGSLLEAAYFGIMAPLPLLVAMLLGLAVVGAVRGSPRRPQRIGLSVGLAWCALIGLLFAVVEVGSGLGADLVSLLRGLSPAGLIGSLSAAIGTIGVISRLAGG